MRLTETSYIVLGLLEQLGPATPYDLKRVAQISTVNFWSVPHTQLYTECARLAEEGLLERASASRPAAGGASTALTDRGRVALERWRSEPSGELEQVRDPATLKLFLGGDPARLAAAQLDAHRHQLVALRGAEGAISPTRREGWRLALEVGIGHEREFIRFWSRAGAAWAPA